MIRGFVDQPFVYDSRATYPDNLADAWHVHLRPRLENAPTVISTFAGCGGSSLGYSMAGFYELAAVEWDRNAGETFRRNFPSVPLHAGDITQLSVDDLRALAGTGDRPLDVLDGSPPCQGFSTAGKRQIDDPRNQLFREFVRLLAGLQPRMFIMENVSGMVKGEHKRLFAEIITELRGAGYTVACRMLNAMYFGVPQSRERLIFIGLRDDLAAYIGTPTHPAAETRPNTVRDAWLDGVGDEPGRPLSGHAAIVAPHVPPGDSNGGGKYGKPRTGKTTGFNMARLGWHRPSCTLPKMLVERTSPIVHPSRDEQITIRQAKRLSGFPDRFIFPSSQTFEQQWAQLGNCVPPLFMAAIARHVRQTLAVCDAISAAVATPDAATALP